MSQGHKNQNNQACFAYKSSCTLLYASNLLPSPDAELLGRNILQQASVCEPVTTGGRGQAWFVEIDEVSAVYRKYMRGGLIARLIQQTYFSLSTENTRSVREWRLLQWMYDNGLPVPQPLAASVCRWPVRLSPFYQAQILLQRIPDVNTFDELLSQQSLEAQVWQSVGQCIRAFHNKGIYHADLNASNILLNADNKVYLIDFDKGERREASPDNAQWKQDNLQRLKRSLLKQQGIHEHYHFSEDSWKSLILGYGNKA